MIADEDTELGSEVKLNLPDGGTVITTLTPSPQRLLVTAPWLRENANRQRQADNGRNRSVQP